MNRDTGKEDFVFIIHLSEILLCLLKKMELQSKEGEEEQDGD